MIFIDGSFQHGTFCRISLGSEEYKNIKIKPSYLTLIKIKMGMHSDPSLQKRRGYHQQDTEPNPCQGKV
jgi:hypothetical protein